MSLAYEVNFDGMVGPTHHYGGLSPGNLASMEHAENPSNPRAAALEGLSKMHLLSQLGVKQVVLPPHPRPSIETLHSLGFRGSDADILAKAAREAPSLLSACSSSSHMWAANSATISPSADSADGRVHITPANLVNYLHRSLEVDFTAHLFRKILPDERLFAHHPALPSALTMGDEGSANHTRFTAVPGSKGVQLFVYGRHAYGPPGLVPKLHPARQSMEASQAIARLHTLDLKATLFAQQDPEAIDAGVFHNDVISVGNGSLFFYHERAFVDTPRIIDKLQRIMSERLNTELCLIPVPEKRVSLEDAVSSYLFNSQIITLPNGKMALLAPAECDKLTSTRLLLDDILAGENPISQVQTVELGQSMRNGGGPACLRLRVVLTADELKAAKQSVFLTDDLYRILIDWVQKHYRDRLTIDDLADPQLLIEVREALAELDQILGLT